MSGHRPRKRFGQHFLTDPGVLAAMLEAIAPSPGQHLVEIGPGRGALTEPLLGSGARVDAIELDRDLVPPLRRRWPLLRVHQADALGFDFAELLDRDGDNGPASADRLRLVGNLPYNISTPLLFHVLDQAALFQDMHFMLQREVVDRLVARPGTKAYGRLTLMVALHCRADALFTVPAEAFMPPPKVESAVVRLAPRERPVLAAERRPAFAELVRRAFQHRRKTLANNLKGLLASEAIAAAGIDPGRRAETLDLAAFLELFEQSSPDLGPEPN